MATNLISTISQLLTPDLITRIASALGLDKYLVDKAMSAAVPGLLAALTSRAQTREGAETLDRAAASQQPGILANLVNAVGGSGQSTLIDSGVRTLGSLLGNANTNALGAAVAKYAGIGDANSKSLMGMLGPLVMGVLGEQQRSTGASASQMLASQKDSIVQALPRGFSDMLRGTGMLADIPGVGNQEYRRAEPIPQRRWDKPASSTPGWILPALAILGLGALAWWALRTPTQTVEAPVAQKTAEAPAVPQKSTGIPTETGALRSTDIDPAQTFKSLTGVKVGDVDLGAQLTNAVNGLRSALDGIKDETTAQAAVPALKESASELQRVTGLIDKLSPEVRKSLAGAVASLRPAIDDMLSKALAIPGVGAVIQPTVATIRTELDTLATA